MKNKFIVVEGPDGSGKSTLSELLQKEIEASGRPCVLLREPGGTLLGESVREILRDPQRNMNARSETLLFCAARAELADKIRALLKRSWVLLDRYEGSTAVYQGIVRGLGAEEVIRLSRWASDDLQPDHTLVLLLEEATARERRDSRGELDRMEETTDPAQVLSGYSWLASQPGNQAISGEGTPEEALAQALRAIALSE